MFSYLRQPAGFYRRLFLLALPIIVQNLITTSLGFLDTFMVGLLGSEAAQTAELLRANGVLPGSGHNAGRLVRFGYAAMTAKADSMLFRAGEALPVHEFHHWDSSENGADFSVRKAEKRQWECGFANAHLYAGFPHLYWAGTALPRRFVQAAQHFLKHKG